MHASSVYYLLIVVSVGFGMKQTQNKRGRINRDEEQGTERMKERKRVIK